LLAWVIEASYVLRLSRIRSSGQLLQNPKMLCFARLSLALLLAMGTGIVKTAK
jgi:hypothetical protein